ncbi:SMI1/KNR4 family protein [Micromonospora sp. DT233]|uniref:SMI1/KNR4 family protein n=1 Tax=Micromonospora sp. DT233 TaxID=3393432 RepID=UPI003CF6BAD3
MFVSESLEQLVRPPAEIPPPVDWGAVEARLGTPLPADYKWLVGRYGTGSFGGFLYVFHPDDPRPGLNLEHQRERTTWALRYLLDRGHALPRKPAELLSLGRSDNGDVIYWITEPAGDPDRWRVALGEPRGPLWEEFDGGAVEWLAAVLSKRLRMRMFPKDFPGRTVRFRLVH